MLFEPPLEEVVFLRRYKRFLVDVERASGERLTIHCPNSGSMRGCQPVGGRAWMSDSQNPKRKLRHTLEIVETDNALCGVNTQRPNALVEEAINDGRIEELTGYSVLQREVRYGRENSRIDILLSEGASRCYVEVKNVTMGLSNGVAQFPDAVTSRGTKHLRELVGMVEEGHRAVLVFCCSRMGISLIQPADSIDPEYGATLRDARKRGVEILCYGCQVTPASWAVDRKISIDLT